MDNIAVKNNIFRYSGFGWGTQRPDKGSGSHVKSWEHYNKAFHFVIENNGSTGVVNPFGETYYVRNFYWIYQDSITKFVRKPTNYELERLGLK